MPNKSSRPTQRKIDSRNAKLKSQDSTRNLFAIYIPTLDQSFVPLKTKVKKNKDLEEVQRDFAEYIAIVIKTKLKRAILSQQYAHNYAPYSKKYFERKVSENWSLNFWQASGHLVNSISVWRSGDIFVVGIPEYFKSTDSISSEYPEGYPTYRIAKVLEFGNEINNVPPRPLFLPVFRSVSKGIGRHLDTFLAVYHPTNKKKYRKSLLEMGLSL